MTLTPEASAELAASIVVAHRIMNGEVIRGSETAITGNLAKAVVYLSERVKELERPKPITFAVEGRGGLSDA